MHKLFVKDRSGELLNQSASRGERPLVVPSLRNIQKAGKEEKSLTSACDGLKRKSFNLFRKFGNR